MITTLRTDMTWDGAVGEMLHRQSEKKIKQALKDMTGAVDVDIIDANSWDEDEDYEDS